MTDSGGARRLCGLLADETRARVFAAAVLGSGTPIAISGATGVPGPAVARAVRQLSEAGLLTASDAGLAPALSRFADAAAGRAGDPGAGEPDAARATVLRRFLTPDGRLNEIPANATKRRVVLEHIVGSFEIGVTYPERLVTLRLREFHPDHAALRRYLVEADLLERRDGIYWRIGGPTET